MSLAALNAKMSRRVLELMESGTRAVGLRLCFHDKQKRSGLPMKWLVHSLDVCMDAKKNHGDSCLNHDFYEVHTALAGNSDGRIHSCPEGFSEIAVPVTCEGEHAGVLFAGVCWIEDDEPPHPNLILPPDRRWLEDRLVTVRALAFQLGELMRGEQSYVPTDRRGEIMSFLADAVDRPVELAELAEEIGLSPSRTGHVVRELFGRTFPELVRSVKMREAAGRLSATVLAVREVAALVGYDDPNYFSRLFSKEFGMPPREYRKRYALEA